MEYKLDGVKFPFRPWDEIFFALSLKQFVQIYMLLVFPINPPDSLRQIAHDFSINLDLIYMIKEYTSLREQILKVETIPTNLIEGALPELPAQKRLEILFQNTFTLLEQLGYAEAIYIWGKQTFRYTAKEIVKALKAICNLLAEATIPDWKGSPVSSDKNSKDWDILRDKQSPFYSRSKLPIAKPPLSAESLLKLQSIVLNQEVRFVQLETFMDTIMESPRTLWDDWALRRGRANHFIRMEGAWRIRLQQWNMIKELLSPDEMEIFQAWLYQHQSQFPDLIIPVPSFEVADSSEKDRND